MKTITTQSEQIKIDSSYCRNSADDLIFYQEMLCSPQLTEAARKLGEGAYLAELVGKDGRYRLVRYPEWHLRCTKNIPAAKEFFSLAHKLGYAPTWDGDDTMLKRQDGTQIRLGDLQQQDIPELI